MVRLLKFLAFIFLLLQSIAISNSKRLANNSATEKPQQKKHEEQQKPESGGSDEKAALAWIQSMENQLEYWCQKATLAGWESGTNITDYTEEVSTNVSLEYSKFKKESIWVKTKEFPWQNFKNKTLKRQFKMMSTIGTDALNDTDMECYLNITTEMQNIFSLAKVADFKNPSNLLPLTPDLEEILRQSTDYDEQEHIWTGWRNQTGRKMIDYFKKFVKLENRAAELNGKSNAYLAWTLPYETSTLREEIMVIWKQIEPLYQQLHAYVRKNLAEQYKGKVAEDGLIPAHILGGMWGQNWFKLLNTSAPFKTNESIDITTEMVRQGYTPTKIFLLADDFFSSVGFPRLPFSFWRDSILEKPNDGREMACQPTAWDFCTGKDFRIRMCTEVIMRDLITAHHEVGHNIYHIAYKDQVQYFRDGANDGFHEAIGDCIAYSVSTPKHMKKLGLLKECNQTKEATINYLYKEALDKIAFLPMALIIDTWRWDIFEGKVKPEDYNCHWWKLRREVQGIKPPNVRTSKDMDAGAKYHIPFGVPYIRYFVSGIVQLQFHKALCSAAGEYDPHDPQKPLHNCDIYGSKEAGIKLQNMLKLGSSVPWPEALKTLTGESELSASALLEYFKPLYDWLVQENKKTNQKIGWNDDGKHLCVP